jgi:hypothetical protein
MNKCSHKKERPWMISSIRYIACILFLLSVAQHIEAKNEFRGFFHRAYIAVVWVHRYGSDPGSGCDAGYAQAAALQGGGLCAAQVSS